MSHGEHGDIQHGRDEHPLPHHVTVKVFAPRFEEPKTFTWPVDWTVRQAAVDAASIFGYQGGEPTLGKGNETLNRNQTLKEAHVHNHDKLELLDVGGGV